MNVLMWVGIGMVSFMIIAAITFIIMKRKNGGGKNLFLLYRTADTTISEVITGEIHIDKANSNKKEYYFVGFNSRLPIIKPTRRVAGVWYREVYLNKHGELSYVNGHSLNIQGHEQNMLSVPEKQLALYMYKEYQEQYQNPVNKAQAVMIVTMFMLAFIATAGAIYTTITFANNTGDIVTIAKENSEVATTNGATTKALVDLVQRLDVITARLSGEVNITRQI